MSIGLNNLHSNKILHRDFKTSNVFLTNNEVVKIGDIGFPKELRNQNNLTNSKVYY